MPRLSVLLPARNAQDTVGQAVASTLRALPRDAELVVLDDGSTDGTAAAADAAAAGDGRLRVLAGEGSGGIAPALNYLLERTDSELVGRMDADDASLPWRFRSALPALGSDRASGADFVFNQVLYWTGTRARPAAPLPISAAAFPWHLLLTNPVSHPAMVARRAALDELGGYRAVPAEDYDLWLRAAAAGKTLRRLGAWGLKYRVSDTQITASDEWRAASWGDPRQAEAFAQLATALTGEPLERVVALAQLPAAQRESGLQKYEELVGEGIAKLPLTERLVLRRRLNKRLEWARTYTKGL